MVLTMKSQRSEGRHVEKLPSILVQVLYEWKVNVRSTSEYESTANEMLSFGMQSFGHARALVGLALTFQLYISAK